ncbi:MAG TPA: TOBE domain-containing protein, partial [Rhodothermia bacterium]|nr:TOBE domain-containing protein [Rhodothermia bacterium]
AMLHRVGVSALFVTHDQEDAFAIADRIAVIRRGRLLQVGTPEDLYNRPASLGVASFIGRSTILPAELVGSAGDRVAVTIGGVRREYSATIPPRARLVGGALRVVLRPDALDLLPPDADAVWAGEVVNRRFAGGSAVYRVKMADNVVMEVESRRMDAREGERIGVGISREPLPVVVVEREDE